MLYTSLTQVLIVGLYMIGPNFLVLSVETFAGYTNCLKNFNRPSACFCLFVYNVNNVMN